MGGRINPIQYEQVCRVEFNFTCGMEPPYCPFPLELYCLQSCLEGVTGGFRDRAPYICVQSSTTADEADHNDSALRTLSAPMTPHAITEPSMWCLQGYTYNYSCG